jgi:transposase
MMVPDTMRVLFLPPYSPELNPHRFVTACCGDSG